MKITNLYTLAALSLSMVIFAQKGLQLKANSFNIKPLTSFNDVTLQKSLELEFKTNAE